MWKIVLKISAWFGCFRHIEILGSKSWMMMRNKGFTELLGSDEGPVVYCCSTKCQYVLTYCMHTIFGDVSGFQSQHVTPPFSSTAVNILFLFYSRPGVWQPCLHNTQTQYCVRVRAIHYWANKVLSLSSALGQQLKTSRQHRGTEGGGGGGGQTLSEPFHQILMNLIEVFRHYKASWRVYLFYGKVQPWSTGADSEKCSVLCVNCMLCRLTAGNCILLRWRMRQTLVPMKFFSYGLKVCQQKVIVRDVLSCYISKRNVPGTFKMIIMSWYFYSSIQIQHAFLFC